MKPRHARQIRAGIQAARQDVRPVMFASDLMAAAYKRTVETMYKNFRPRIMLGTCEPTADVWQMVRTPLVMGPPEAAETFTHPTTPTAADKAAGDKPAPLPPAIDITVSVSDDGDIQFLGKEK